MIQTRQTNRMEHTQMDEILKRAALQIINMTMDAIITVDEEQRILLFNQASVDMFGCDPGEAIGESLERFIPERYRHVHHEHFRTYAETGVANRRLGRLGEIIGLRTNGSEFPAEASISKVDAEGKKLFTVVIRDMTERKIVEAGLLNLTQQHQLLLHSAGEGIYGVDQHGHVTFFNRAAESMTGWKPEEILGKFIHSVIHHTKPDGTPYPWEECNLLEVLTDGVEHHIGNEAIWRKDGSSFQVDYRANPIRDEAGQITGAVVTFQDTTDRKEHHLRLLALANRNQALLEAIPDMVVEVDIHKKMTWLNDEALKFYGSDALGKEPKEYFVGDQDAYDKVQPLFEGANKVIHLESWQRRQDGQSRLLEWWCRSLRDGQGMVIGSLSTARDVTDRTHAAERLIESEKRFRTMVEHLPGGAIFTDGVNLIVNAAVVQMAGYSKSELSTMDAWCRLLYGPDESVIKKLYEKDKKMGFPHTRLLPIHRKDGVLRYVEFSMYGWEQGEVWLLHDVTDRHEARIALLEGKAALEKSQADLQTLTARLLTAQEDERRRISRDLHDDLNQRLAILALKIQTAQQNVDKSDANFGFFQKLYDDVSDLSDEVRHLAYQLHPSILDDLGLKPALRSLIDEYSKWENIPVTFTAKPVPATLNQDISSCLYRLAQESLRNIAKHAQATQVRVSLAPLNDGIQLEIEDNGVGFEPEAASLKKGLGLIGMQERIRLMNGTWSVQAHPGDGVTVSAWIPLPQENI